MILLNKRGKFFFILMRSSVYEIFLLPLEYPSHRRHVAMRETVKTRY